MSQASHEFKGSVDFNQYELRNATFQNLISPPISPKQGQIYFDSSNDKKIPYYWDSTKWVPFGVETVSDKNYIHIQSVSSNTWTIVHNLNKFPSVAIIDSANTEVTGNVEYVDNNTVIASFSGSFSGKAYLN